MSIHNLPLSENTSAQDMLVAASRRDFKEILILGVYEDGEMRHASTMKNKDALWMLELYKLKILGLIEGATVGPVGDDKGEPS